MLHFASSLVLPVVRIHPISVPSVTFPSLRSKQAYDTQMRRDLTTFMIVFLSGSVACYSTSALPLAFLGERFTAGGHWARCSVFYYFFMIAVSNLSSQRIR